MNYLIVSVGAALGGAFRYWVSNITYKLSGSAFPYGTLVVNLLGSFIVGLVMFYFAERELISPQLRLFLTIGFCGGFTTFSTFSYETFTLLKDSQYTLGLVNIAINLILCLTGITLAYLISKAVS